MKSPTLSPEDEETLKMLEDEHRAQKAALRADMRKFPEQREREQTPLAVPHEEKLRQKRIEHLAAHPDLMFMLYRETWMTYLKRRLGDPKVKRALILGQKRTREQYGHPEKLPKKLRNDFELVQNEKLAKEVREAILYYCKDDVQDFRYNEITDALHASAVAELQREFREERQAQNAGMRSDT